MLSHVPGLWLQPCFYEELLTVWAPGQSSSRGCQHQRSPGMHTTSFHVSTFHQNATHLGARAHAGVAHSLLHFPFSVSCPWGVGSMQPVPSSCFRHFLLCNYFAVSLMHLHRTFYCSCVRFQLQNKNSDQRHSHLPLAKIHRWWGHPQKGSRAWAPGRV